ncbi:hypothetical protein V2J09_019011 [Rumex salicifolius]
MVEVGETSSAPTATERPLVVRVKRKSSQSPVEAFWLEINERPLKRALLDFENLSISSSSGKEESRTRRFFVKHVETVSSSENTIDAVQSFVQAGSDNGSRFSTNSRERHSFRKENKQKQGQLLSKAKQQQEALSKNSRFELIWRSRKGNKEGVHDEALNEVCRLYDVDRVDVEGTSVKANKQEKMSKEDQESLYKFLPLLRELVPDAAEDIEADMDPNVCIQDGFVYDLYTVGDNAEEVDDSQPFLLVQVDDTDDWYDGPNDPDYETDDSNDENHPVNDYPEEESSEEDESETSTDESDEEEEETGSEESTTDEDPEHLDIADDDMDNDYFDDDIVNSRRDSDEDDDDDHM